MRFFSYIRVIFRTFIYATLQIRFFFFPPPVSLREIDKRFTQKDLDHLGENLFGFTEHDREAISVIYSQELTEQEKTIYALSDNLLEQRFSIYDIKNRYAGKVINWHKDYRTAIVRKKIYIKFIDLAKYYALSDIKYVWEINRFQFLFDLGKAFYLTSDEKYSSKARDLIEDWINNNPYKIGVNWLSGLELGLRAIAWIWAYHLFRRSPQWSPEFKRELVRQLILHGNFIINNFSIREFSNNHLIGEASALFFIGHFLKNWPESTIWKDTARKILEKEIISQVYSDGGDKEQAFEYHRFVTDFFTLAYLTGLRCDDPFSSEYEQRLQNMYGFMIRLFIRDNPAPHVGDDDGGYVLKLGASQGRQFSQPVVTAHILFPARFPLYTDYRSYEEIVWLFGPETWNRLKKDTVEDPHYTSAILPDSGYGISRSGWGPDDHYVLFDFGDQGMGTAGHGHADALSFAYHYGNAPVFVDSGTYAYTGNPDFRNYFLSSFAHNVVIVNNSSHAERIDASYPFGWKRKVGATLKDSFLGHYYDYFDAEHDGYSSLGVHAGRILMIQKGSHFLLIDYLSGNQKYNVVRRFHLHPALRVRSHKTGFKIDSLSGNIKINGYVPDTESIGIDYGMLNPISGWYSDRYGERQETHVVTLSSACEDKTCLPLLADTSNVFPSGKNPEFFVYSDENLIRVKISFSDQEVFFLKNTENKNVEFDTFQTDAGLLYAVTKKTGGIAYLLMRDATRLFLNGRDVYLSPASCESLEYINGLDHHIRTGCEYQFNILENEIK